MMNKCVDLPLNFTPEHIASVMDKNRNTHLVRKLWINPDGRMTLDNKEFKDLIYPSKIGNKLYLLGLEVCMAPDRSERSWLEFHPLTDIN